MKGKDQYSWTPRTSLFRSAAFHTQTIYFLFYKTTYVDEDVNWIDRSPSLRFPELSILGMIVL